MTRFVFIVLVSLGVFVVSPASAGVAGRGLAALGAFAALFGVSLVSGRLRPVAGRAALAGAVGLVLGALTARLLEPWVGGYAAAVGLVLAYAGFVLGHDHGPHFVRSDAAASGEAVAEADAANFVKYKILDTSSIIDGRILDIGEAGFLEGIVLIPRFVLQELQTLSDSSDGQKRIRGRRGMELVNRMQKSKAMLVQIVDRDFPETREVDNKLINLAKELGAAIVTTDFNLAKTAQIQGLRTFNVNKLAEALKPVVMPGQKMDILIVKQGKDPNQGVGYLEDGTMVVVENASRSVNKKRKVEVTSVIQTETGRMIFGK